ncbi:hypothetical protein I4U23_020264 [Adineta vaga]|nr:hypothetical protein I4U23_020264 [Adineta vaga]
MRSFFRSRLPPQLTSFQITRLSNQSKLSFEEIEHCYDQFILCYPYGYISFKDFRLYLKQLLFYNGNDQCQYNQLSKMILKQLFYRLNVNQEKKLSFEEFFRFNTLIAQESNENTYF